LVDGKVEAIWEQGFTDSPRLIGEARSAMLPTQKGAAFHPVGKEYEETMYPGWTRRDHFPERPTMTIDGDKHILLFGDTHAHSWTSDGADPADYYYHFARDFAGLDVFGLSDHDFRVAGSPGIEAYIAFLPKAFDSPDFICFQGYEFSSGRKGHRCVVFEGGQMKPQFPHARYIKEQGGPHTVAEHNAFLHRFGMTPDSRVLVTAHNMFNVGNDFSQYDESLEPLYDVCSIHIEAEKTIDEYIAEGTISSLRSYRFHRLLFTFNTIIAGSANDQKPEKKWFHSYRQVLGESLPLGAYGNSDTHASSGIGWVTSGVWVKEKNRKSVFDSWFERKTFALDSLLRTSDVNNCFPHLERREKDYPIMWMDLRLWLDDQFMGRKVKVDAAPEVKVYAAGHEPSAHVAKIVFVKDGEEAHKVNDFDRGPVETSWKDDAWSPGRHYYYARIEFRSGQVGYTSPAFANY